MGRMKRGRKLDLKKELVESSLMEDTFSKGEEGECSRGILVEIRISNLGGRGNLGRD